MQIAAILRAFASGQVDWNTRPVTFHFGKEQRATGHLKAIRHVDVREGMMADTCASTCDDRSSRLFLELPVSVCLTSDTAGELPEVHADRVETLSVQFIKKNR
ncbi:hypothetical protein [Burkholderia cepacia]|uniref:hypothetical protein n=1 Tax=Burkholderia cepacia TaxID=292 RepID=UPI0011BF587D|nr:hypothetical protein [Burkholderia cepacia]MCE4127589.1 hypothetical protein [Burkholderia cepacia]MDN7860813.1 hypothetical protein [Burkholderia cepacia]NTX46323.1 hypothetical protein [Burkholderia cepacia]